MNKRLNRSILLLVALCLAVAALFCVAVVPVSAAEDSELTLELIGDSTIYLKKGTEYKEYGVTACDSVEGDLTEAIVVKNNVNKDSVGTYTVTYSVTNSASKKVTKERKIVVFDAAVDETLYSSETTYATSSFNRYEKILHTSDGGYLFLGQAYYPYTIYIKKYNSSMISQWTNSFYHYSQNYTNTPLDAIELTDENILLLSYNSGYGFYYLTIIDGTNGSLIYDYQVSNSWSKIQKLSDTQYIICPNGASRYGILNYDIETQTFTTQEISTSFEVRNAIVLNGYLYSFFSSGKVYRMNLDTNEVTETALGISLDTCIEEVNGEYIFICNGKSIYKLNSDLTIVDSFEYSDSNIQDFCVNDDLVVAKYVKNIVFLNNNLDFIGETYTKYGYTASDIYVDAEGDVYYCGGDSSSYLRAVKLSNITLFSGIETYYSKVGQPIDYYNGVDIISPIGETIGTYTCDYSQVDITKAGNYKAYYTFSVIEDEDVKTYYVGRDIIVEPTTTFEEGAVYSGSKVVDVEGGTVKINGVEYFYGDVYSIPGNSTMVITGENGYSKTINFTIGLVVDGIENDGVYFANLTPYISGGTITMNGENYTSETPITVKGNHTIVITGAKGFKETIKFTLEPTVISVDDGKTYLGTIYPNINAENMTLNGVPYNNEPIENCGNYTLVINGVGGYQKTLNFVIETVISDLVDGERYEGQVTPSFTKGTATLNGEEYISGTTIYTPGVNTLIITGENEYSVTYTFTVVLIVDNVVSGETYIGEVTPVISGGAITLNGEEFVSGTKIDVPGNYTVTVNGAAGYCRSISFVVKPYEIGVEMGGVYNHAVIPAVSNGTMTLNGEEYASGSVINVSGEYTLLIIGEGGYYETICFTLISGANVEDGESYDHPITLEFIGVAELNGEVVLPDTVIDKIGNYTLILTDGETVITYNFVIEPDYSVFDGRIHSATVDMGDVVASSVILNGSALTEAITVTEVGAYSLTVDGVNGYSKTVDFVIAAEMNVVDGGEYASGLVLNANGGNITLDGEGFVDVTILTEVGT